MSKEIFVLGPSHIHCSQTRIIKEKIDNGILFSNCILDAYCGLPNWSKRILDQLHKNSHRNLVWIVSDYKFNNFDYDRIKDIVSKNELFLDTVGCPGNVDKNFLEQHHIETLGNHSLNVIDYIISIFPDIKLIFWCLYKRTKVNKNSSYPKYLWYDSIKEKYTNNIIDIDKFTNPDDFSKMILDEGGHPNQQGYVLLNDIIKSAFINR